MERHTHTVRKSSIFTNIFKLWMEFFLIINTHKFCYLRKENLMKKVDLNAPRVASEKFCNGGDKKWNKSCTFAAEWRIPLWL